MGLIVTLPTAVRASFACFTEFTQSKSLQRWDGASSWQGYDQRPSALFTTTPSRARSLTHFPARMSSSVKTAM